MLILLRVLAIMLGVQMIAYAQLDNAPEIEPDPSIQLWIKQVVTLETQEQLLQAISTFKKQGISAEKIIQQLIYFQVNAKQIYKDEKVSNEDVSKRAMVANGIIAFLLDWDAGTKKLTASSSCTLINAVLPYLGTKNPQLRKELHHTLMWVDQVRGGAKDFTEYEKYLKDRKSGPPETLVKYIFDRDPKAAVLSMARIYGDKATESQLADQIKGDPKAALPSLADRPEWWAHLYVAETMKRNPQLCDPEILKRLEKDEHPLVQEAIATIKSSTGQSKNTSGFTVQQSTNEPTGISR